ncbi:MAG: hypothetical protein NT062_10770, partial [Proteobacteria bacterium]|nr:hypothetical protein [Pseudomonadota bacterium]
EVDKFGVGGSFWSAHGGSSSVSQPGGSPFFSCGPRNRLLHNYRDTTIRAAEQFILGGWRQIESGHGDSAIMTATGNLAQAVALLSDPNISDAGSAAASDIVTMDQVVQRLIMNAEGGGLRMSMLLPLAQTQDRLARLVTPDAPAKWTEEIGKHSGKGAAEPEPPRAESAMHREVDEYNLVKRVYLRDTNYIDEELGYLVLEAVIAKTATGQLYGRKAKVIPFLSPVAMTALTFGANVLASSIERAGKKYCEIDFDVTVAGPSETNTEEFGVSASLGQKMTNKNGDDNVGIGASMQLSRATVTRANSSFRRVYNVESPGTEKSAWNVTKAPGHKDFDGLIIDDDDAGDTILTTFADWEIESYGED